MRINAELDKDKQQTRVYFVSASDNPFRRGLEEETSSNMACAAFSIARTHISSCHHRTTKCHRRFTENRKEQCSLPLIWNRLAQKESRSFDRGRSGLQWIPKPNQVRVSNNCSCQSPSSRCNEPFDRGYSERAMIPTTTYLYSSSPCA